MHADYLTLDYPAIWMIYWAIYWIIQVKVTVAGLHDGNQQICSRQVILGVETSLKDAILKVPYDAILLPGGAKGAEAFVAVK